MSNHKGISLLKKIFVGVLLSMQFFIASASDVIKGRQTISLNGEWQFKTDDNNQGINEKWYQQNFPSASWERLMVPGNWDTKNKYANYKGKAWYRKKITLPSYANKIVNISFEAVGMTYKLYVNGNKVAEVLVGNNIETFNITPFLKPLQPNTIAVQVDNTLKWGAYWSWGGIRRPVEIQIEELVSVKRQQIVSEVSLDSGTAVISTTVYLVNQSNSKKNFKVQQTILQGQENVKQSAIKNIVLEPYSEKNIEIKIALSRSQTRLWHFDHPDIYKSIIHLTESNNIIYSQQDKFGIRKIELKGTKLFLNGESVRLAGYNWVAEDRTTGSTVPEFRYKQDIDHMKSAGANMARLSHRPLPQEVMDYLDSKGILVFAEFNNWPDYMNGTSQEPLDFASKLVEQNFNHPSVIGWCVGNENGNLNDFPKVNEYVARIISFIKEKLDPTRLVSYASHTADIQDNDAAQYCDMILINRYGNYQGSIQSLHKRYPGKAVFMSEYGGHTSNMIYDTPGKTFFNNLMVDSLYQNENLIGYSIWTYNDYRSTYQTIDPKTSTPLHQNRQWGIVDAYGNKKSAFKQMQDFYAPVNALVSTYKIREAQLDISCSLTPRKITEIPAYALKGYQLIWEVRNNNNKNIQMGSIPLKNIEPSASTIIFDTSIASNKGATFIKWSLLSPTGYVVKYSTNYLAAARTPEIKDFLIANTGARIILDKNFLSESYQLVYELDNKEFTLPASTDHYLELINLPIGKKITCWVVAVNGCGKSAPSKKMEFQTTAGYTSLPPIIWQSEPSDKGFYVGYSCHYSDNQYELRYSLDKDTKSWNSITTGNFGMLEVPNLNNHKTYYYQLRRFGAYNNTASLWSEMKTVIPNPNHQYGNIQLHGYVQQKNELIISVTSSTNAKGIIVTCTNSLGETRFVINQSVVELIHLQLPNEIPIQQVEISEL